MLQSQCGRFSLSQIVICKGVNTPENRGKRYQVVSAQPKRCIRRLNYCTKCLFNIKYSRMSPEKAKTHVMEAQENGMPPIKDSYRPCKTFTWLEETPKAPAWWIEAIIRSMAKPETDFSIKCPGRTCKDRRNARVGNKSCTNGLLCRQCWDDYQKNGFLPKCGYSSHNYKRKLGRVSRAMQ